MSNLWRSTKNTYPPKTKFYQAIIIAYNIIKGFFLNFLLLGVTGGHGGIFNNNSKFKKVHRTNIQNVCSMPKMALVTKIL